MLTIFLLLLSSFRSYVCSRAALQAEILALRHQLLVPEVCSWSPTSIAGRDRIFWVCLSRLWQGRRSLAKIMKPETITSWNRKGFRLYWSWKSRVRNGRPCVSREIRDLIRRISLANPRWGAPRVHGELQKLGIEDEHVVETFAPDRADQPFHVCILPR